MTRAAMLRACAAMVQLNPDCLFVVWFENTYNELDRHLSAFGGTHLQWGDRMNPADAVNRMIVFTEHHPLAKKEQDLFLALRLSEAPVLSSLEEPLFQMLIGEKTVTLLKELGMTPDDHISHSFVTKAIRRAQEKIAQGVHSDLIARSQQEWLDLNFLKR